MPVTLDSRFRWNDKGVWIGSNTLVDKNAAGCIKEAEKTREADGNGNRSNSQKPQKERAGMPVIEIDIKEAKEDLFAELIARITASLQKEKMERAAAQAQTKIVVQEAGQRRAEQVRLMLLAANECLRNTQQPSPAFTTLLFRPLIPRFAYDASYDASTDKNPPVAVLPLFGDVVSPVIYGQVCLVNREDRSICIDILVQRVTRDYLERDESVLERLPVSFDKKLENLANPETLIEAVLRALLDCRK